VKGWEASVRSMRGAAAAVFLIALLVWLGGCWLYNVPPVAGFTMSAQSGEVPLTVDFSAVPSSDEDGTITAYEWDFGDGTAGAGKSVSHTYDAAATYVVMLRVTDDDGDFATARKTVYVLPGEPPGPAASFTASPSSGTSPLSVRFDASGSTYENGTINWYEWDFGDGAMGYGRTVSHTYYSVQQQTYTVRLTVYGTDGKTGTATGSVSVTVTGGGTPAAGAPSARFDIQFDDVTQDPAEEYANDDVAPVRAWFDPSDSMADTGRTLTAYIWSFGDGSTETTISPTIIPHTFITDEASEVFAVTLIVTDDGNPAASDSITKTVRAENYQPVAGFEVYSLLDDGANANIVVGGEWWTGLDEEDGDNDDDRVSFYGVNPAADNEVWIRTQEIVDPDWLAMATADPTPNGENDEPTEFDDENGPNMCFDPEGQTWEGLGDPPAWFPNRAWGIQRLRVNWGDGNTDIVEFLDNADTLASHVYDFGDGNVKSWTITVTAIDYLGAQRSFSRVITMNEGGG